jgi:YVTN family beta-propeller protein
MFNNNFVMCNNNSNESRTASARGFMAFFAMLAMGFGLMASPAEAAPFAYVASFETNSVSVIDTATNLVVATVPVGDNPIAVAVNPDGTRAYVTNSGSSNVSVIETATNSVVDTVPVGSFPEGVAVTPDGKHAYVTNDCILTGYWKDALRDCVLIGAATEAGVWNDRDAFPDQRSNSEIGAYSRESWCDGVAGADQASQHSSDGSFAGAARTHEQKCFLLARIAGQAIAKYFLKCANWLRIIWP